jgi:hypothetical protein
VRESFVLPEILRDSELGPPSQRTERHTDTYDHLLEIGQGSARGNPTTRKESTRHPLPYHSIPYQRNRLKASRRASF